VIAVPTSDAWALSGGPTAGSMPLTFLSSQQPSDVARWTDLTQVYLVIDALAAVTVNMVALLYTNMTSAATWRIRGATSVANLTNGSAGYDSRVGGVDLTMITDPAETWWDRLHAYLWVAATIGPFRYWRVDIADAANPAGYFQAGRLYMGNMYQASRGAKLGGDVMVTEVVPTSSSSSAHQVSGGGQAYPAVRVKTGGITFGMEFLPKSEVFRGLYQIVRRRGGTKDVFVLLDPDDRSFAMEQSCYGTLAVGVKFTWTTLSAVTGLPLISQEFTVAEMP
jgi:hypothetical protein